MRKAVAILFSVLLALTQPLFGGGLSCANQPGPCCDCGGKMKCCAAQEGQPAAPSPATPTTPSLQTDFHLLPFTGCVVTVFNRPENNPVAPQATSYSLGCAVPLFTWNCAFLI